ncbi:preprotein translocase subunit SecA [Chlamydiota bacterium]
MIGWILKKTIGTKNERAVKKYNQLVDQINVQEQEYQSLSEEQIKAKTHQFKERLAGGETLDDLLVEAFATVKNVCRRLLGNQWAVCGHMLAWEMVPFDVQLIGAIVLHEGKIAEMATGEGKTLVATLPLYLNALLGKGVHLVTVNDYLARRDSEWMGKIFEFLGLTIGCLQNNMDFEERKAVYGCDIVYGTNSEFGFDYLRDNSFSHSTEEQVQRSRYFVIIDEVDSILIDEARTPLIISGPTSVSTHKYTQLKPLVSNLVQKQTYLCNRILTESKELLADKETEWQGVVKLFQVRRGTPKNKQFLRMLEDPSIRKIFEKAELELNSDMRKDERHNALEELYFTMDERSNEVDLTELGREALSPNNPEDFVMPDMITAYQEIDEDEALTVQEKETKKFKLSEEFNEKSEKIHNLSQLLRAYCLFEKDIAYVIQDNKVLIVDEFTGRIMPGRRYSDGLHQALEAKEGVKIEKETQTYATITIQNYFRMYEKLAGMTGTAETEAGEFFEIYKLSVIVIPTNDMVRRIDCNDVIYKTRREKFNAIVDEIEMLHQNKLPVLIGTISVETSEILSRLLKRRGINHAVLNAKYHQQEAEIIVRAGQGQAVTIATNMAGRGTDIKLGTGVVKSKNCGLISLRDTENPCPYLKELNCYKNVPCGLHVIGSERHEARRIDRQLRGRSGRQGDPGYSRFYVSLEDDLMRLFGSDRIATIMEKMGIDEGQDLTHPLLTRSIETAQKRVEQRNFAIRKHTLEYDDVMNKQREAVYNFRNRVLTHDNLKEDVFATIDDVVTEKLNEFLPENTTNEEADLLGLLKWCDYTFLTRTADEEKTIISLSRDEIKEKLLGAIYAVYDFKETVEGHDNMRLLEKFVMLHAIDKNWKDHLYNMDNLREGVGLRAYGQKDPLIEYKAEGFAMFQEMMNTIDAEIAASIIKHSLRIREENVFKRSSQDLRHDSIDVFAGTGAQIPQESVGNSDELSQARQAKRQRPEHTPIQREAPKVGRNDPCPCGSGKKHKKCCG